MGIDIQSDSACYKKCLGTLQCLLAYKLIFQRFKIPNDRFYGGPSQTGQFFGFGGPFTVGLFIKQDDKRTNVKILHIFCFG